MNIAVLGATGMLGKQVLATLESGGRHRVTATCREASAARLIYGQKTSVVHLEAEGATVDNIARAVGDCLWWINCVGVIKQRIRDDDPNDIARASLVNSVFPARLAAAARLCGARVIQIATDCVWDGESGSYLEDDAHTAKDVYGRSKSIGEIQSEGFHSVRCSTVGLETGTPVSLLGWFLAQKEGAAVNGFIDHLWNGVTTLQFARFCTGVIDSSLTLKPLQHLVPADSVSKHTLLELFARHFGRDDLAIRPIETSARVDRTLATNDPAHNLAMWKAAGYAEPPAIEQAVIELAAVRGRS